MTNALSQPASIPLQEVRMKDPDAALGVAVRLFLRHEQFLKLQFGEWASSLNGHIMRDHYRFVLRGNEVVGYFGWCLTDEAHAERWYAGGGLPFDASHNGDCVILNAWVADTVEVNQFIVERARLMFAHCKYLYGRRYYLNGRMRPLKLHTQPFVTPKLKRAQAAT